MTADDVSKLAAFAYHSHPDIFQEVLVQPAIMKFISNPLMRLALGAIASKLFKETVSEVKNNFDEEAKLML